MSLPSSKLIQMLANTCSITIKQAESTVHLIDDGNTVPFIARYRKQETQSLDDTQLRLIERKLHYFRDLETRKLAILKSLEKQGKLSDTLVAQIEEIEDKVSLEHCYAPFKTTRVSKSKLAEAAGLSLLAEALWKAPRSSFNAMAHRYINIKKDFATNDQVIEGALAIAIEGLSQDITLFNLLVEHLNVQGMLTATVVKSKINDAIKYKDYFEYSGKLNNLPAHRVLAMLRGKAEGYLRLKLNPDPFQKTSNRYSYCQTLIAKHLNIYLPKDDDDSWHRKVIDTAWRTKLLVNLEKHFLVQLKVTADAQAIDQFANNLNALLMAPPAGEKVTLGLDPGFKSGCKLAVIDKVGNLIDTATIFPHHPQLRTEQAKQKVIDLLLAHNVELIAIGNGTASRESEHFIEVILKEFENAIHSIAVSEAGASVYSASELAANEFPTLDVTLRGAVSIARRLQDPLSELVKIDAKAIGVGLYQHDVQQSLLSKRLQAVVEDCVNKVGVDLNTASAHLLTYVAGLNTTIAQNIVTYRLQNGRFTSRHALNKVPRLGAKAFQQAAGFLKVSDGNDPLDETILHPEQYALAHRLIQFNGVTLQKILFLDDIPALALPKDALSDEITAQMYRDIVSVLSLSRRDPRTQFSNADFDQRLHKISDVAVDMVVQGVVTNVANFGAFIDIGVHQDGLVHISMLSDTFISDPHKIIKVGQIVNVKVVSVDVQRKRIALSMQCVQQPS